MFLFPEVRYLKFSRPRIRPKTPEFGSKRIPHLRSTVPNVQRHMAYFATAAAGGAATRLTVAGACAGGRFAVNRLSPT